MLTFFMLLFKYSEHYSSFRLMQFIRYNEYRFVPQVKSNDGNKKTNFHLIYTHQMEQNQNDTPNTSQNYSLSQLNANTLKYKVYRNYLSSLIQPPSHHNHHSNSPSPFHTVKGVGVLSPCKM